MLAKTGLLVVSNPNQLGKILPLVQKQVNTTLYIQLSSALTEPFGGFHPHVLTSWPKYSQTIYGIYSQAATHCKNLDVRVLLSGLKYSTVSQIHTKSNIDVVIFDKSHSSAEIENFVATRIASIAKNYSVVTLDAGQFESLRPPDEGKVYKHTVLGGTFDRLHVAHKLLLSEAALRAEEKVTVGVTEECLLAGKVLWELVEDLTVRMQNVQDFLSDICAELRYHLVPITDPFGPAITDPTMDMIVVSDETIRGGNKINEIREQRSLTKLDVLPVRLLDEPHRSSNEEPKISSSNARIRLLGTLLKKPVPKSLGPKPYVIGLTGGVASGKSGVATWLAQCGAEVINCDLIGHEVYRRGKPCHARMVEHFGAGILTPEGEIDRRAVGAIVFKSPDELKVLNSLVWPEIGREVLELIANSKRDVVVVEAAVLLAAGWDKYCHEVWTTLIPRNEAIKRLVARNGLTEDQAAGRIDSQPTNKVYVRNANVVLCTLWEVEDTRKQVETAWGLLQRRLL